MKKLISAVLSVVVGTGIVYAKATTGVAIFSHGVGARQLGMADVAGGIADDANALFYNPAGLAQINALELNAMYFDNIIDTKDEAVSMAMPLRKGIFGNKAALGLGLKAYQGGDLEYIRLDTTGTQILEQKTLSAESDYLASIGYAEKIAQGTYAGFAIKGIHSTLVEDYTASAVALDAGLLYHLPIEGLSIGVSILNAGTEMKFIDEGDALPQRIVAGTGYKLKPMKSVNVMVGADYIKERKEDGAANVGLEIGLLDMVTVRTGYYTDSDLGSMTMGIGVRLGWVQLDYGYGMMDELNNLHKASLTFRWNTAQNEVAKKKAVKKTTVVRKKSKKEVVVKKAPSKEKKKVVKKKTANKQKTTKKYTINK